MMIRQHDRILSQRSFVHDQALEFFELRGWTHSQEYLELKERGKFRQSRIDISKVSEAYTSQICNECHSKTLKKKWIQTTSRNRDDEVEIRWKQLRCFECTNPNHSGRRFVQRDKNASANIGQNIIYFGLDKHPMTTWHIGKEESFYNFWE